MFLSWKVPGWKCLQGHKVGQPIIDDGWLDDRTCRSPVANKQGVHDPLLEGDANNRFDWQLCLGAAVTGIIGVAALMMFVGAILDGDALAMFRDIAKLAR